MRLTDISEWSKFFHKKLDNILPDSIHDSGYRHAMQDVDAWIAEHTIEAETVRHGRWVIEKRHAVSRNPYMDDNYFASATCSECDFCIHAETKSFGYPNLNTTNYCPNCGAKMESDSNDEG